MTLLLHITLAKLKRDAKTGILQAIAVLVSMLVISFFLSFVLSLRVFMAENPTFGLEGIDGESLLTVASVQTFFKEILSGITTVACAVAALSAVSLFIFTRMRAERSKQFFATLTSIGATVGQRRVIALTEALLLYGPPIVIGSLLGLLPSRPLAARVARVFVSDYVPGSLPLLVPLLLALLGIGAVLLFASLSAFGRRGSVIESVKAHNKKEALARHGYRRSYTFRHMPIEKRVAKKGVAYYATSYRRISFMLFTCAAYPLLAVLFFLLVSKTGVSEYTPGQGIDVAALVTLFAERIALFGILAFLALSVLGIGSAAYVIRVHSRIRREAMQAYRSVGMTDLGIRRVLRYEYRTAVFHAAVGLIFVLVLLAVGIYELL